jgi:uncharacterized protein (TIGR03000 family)
MSLPQMRTVGIVTMALLGIALASKISAAEQGWPLNPENRTGTYSSPRYYRNSVPAYSAPLPVQMVAPRLATTPIHVLVPDQAKVWVENQPTSQTGSARDFVSPPLAPGLEYRYTVRASWQEQGREIVRQQIVAFTAGDQVSIDFTTSMVSVQR